MPEKIKSEDLDEMIYKLGVALRESASENSSVEVEFDGLIAQYKNNYITIKFATMAHNNIAITIHILDLPSKHQNFLQASLAQWFNNIVDGYLVETKEVIQA